MTPDLAVAATSTMILCALFAAPPSRGPLDVVIASHEGIQVWFRNGNGRFQAGDQGFLELPSTTGVALGDLDGDGDPDLFVTRYEQHPNQVWFNEGKGVFRNSGQSRGIRYLHEPSGTTLGRSGGHDVVLVDLDADRDLDAMVVELE